MSKTSFRSYRTYNSTKNKAKENYKYSLNKAKSFFISTLRDRSITSTFIVGKEVYNIRDKDSNKVLGFLGYLVFLNKLNSLVNYITRKALEFKLKNFIIILNYALENKFYYIIYNSNSITKEEFLNSSIELRREFTLFKNYFLSKER